MCRSGIDATFYSDSFFFHEQPGAAFLKQEHFSTGDFPLATDREGKLAPRRTRMMTQEHSKRAIGGCLEQ